MSTRASGGVLDGTLLERFAVEDDAARKGGLAQVYRDRPLFARLMVLFVAVFTSFLNDRGFYIRGIGPDGIRAVV